MFGAVVGHCIFKNEYLLHSSYFPDRDIFSYGFDGGSDAKDTHSFIHTL